MTSRCAVLGVLVATLFTTGCSGPAGPAGPSGPAGAPGSAGGGALAGYEVVQINGSPDANTSKSLTAGCPPGKLPFGGGGSMSIGVGVSGDVENLVLTASLPFSPTNGWLVKAKSLGSTPGTTWRIHTWVVCAPASP